MNWCKLSPLLDTTQLSVFMDFYVSILLHSRRICKGESYSTLLCLFRVCLLLWGLERYTPLPSYPIFVIFPFGADSYTFCLDIFKGFLSYLEVSSKEKDRHSLFGTCEMVINQHVRWVWDCGPELMLSLWPPVHSWDLESKICNEY